VPLTLTPATPTTVTVTAPVAEAATVTGAVAGSAPLTEASPVSLTLEENENVWSPPSHGFATGYALLTQDTATREYNLDQIVEVGGQHVRIDCPDNETAQGQLDTLMPLILARDLQPMLILYGSEKTAVAAEAAATFTTAMMVKWKSVCRMFEFVNEPDLNATWTPANYTEAAVASYDAAKAEHPDCYWIIGALWKWKDTETQNTHHWVQQMYEAGIAGKFDALSFHGYDYPTTRASWNIWDHVFHDSGNVRDTMVANGDGAKHILSTENGARITGEGGTYTEAQQDEIVDEDFNALTTYASANLKMHTVYSMMNNDVAGWGLLRTDLTRRPAWYTYRLRALGF
jgi:hypothetical protein